MRSLIKRKLTEDDLVEAARETLASWPAARARQVRVGIGDDAAVWKPRPSHLCLITSDTLVDGVHFRLQATTAKQLGHKALAKNLSDIAAMGGRPTLAIAALGLTASIDEAWLREFYGGMAALAATCRCEIAGGDIVAAPALTLGITVVGEARRTHLRLRSGARPKDVIAVTGPLGLAAAGLRVLDAGAREKLRAASASQVCDAYLAPAPRLREGALLGARRACHALMDISDGLSTDVARMATASKVDAVIKADALVPLPALADAAAAVSADSLDLMLNGGDDYELLAAIESRSFDHVAHRLERLTGHRLIVVGRFEAGSGEVWLEKNGQREKLERSGWDHIARM